VLPSGTALESTRFIQTRRLRGELGLVDPLLARSAPRRTAMSTTHPETSQSPEQTSDATMPPENASPIPLVALRDVLIVITLLSIWAGAEAWASQSGLGMAAALSSIGGLLVGAATTALLHEWGHFVGARSSGGTAPVSPAGNFLPLFLFDFDRSEEEHFRAMSVGGNVAHWATALALFVMLPGATAGQLALQCGSLGFAVFASTIEFPVLRRAFAGEPGAQALATIRTDTIQRAGWIGFATALGTFVVFS